MLRVVAPVKESLDFGRRLRLQMSYLIMKTNMNKQKVQRRRAPSTTDEQMLDLHDSPVYGVDLSQDTRMLELHSRLVILEDRIRFFIEVPMSVVRVASSTIQTIVIEKLPTSVRKRIEEAMRGELGRKRRLRKAN